MEGGEYCGKEVLEQHISLNFLVLSIFFFVLFFWFFLVSVKNGSGEYCGREVQGQSIYGKPTVSPDQEDQKRFSAQIGALKQYNIHIKSIYVY